LSDADADTRFNAGTVLSDADADTRFDAGATAGIIDAWTASLSDADADARFDAWTASLSDADADTRFDAGTGAAGVIVDAGTGAAGVIVDAGTGAAGVIVDTGTGTVGVIVDTGAGAVGVIVDTGTGAVGVIVNTGTGCVSDADADTCFDAGTGAAGAIVDVRTVCAAGIGPDAHSGAGTNTGVVSSRLSTCVDNTEDVFLCGMTSAADDLVVRAPMSSSRAAASTGEVVSVPVSTATWVCVSWMPTVSDAPTVAPSSFAMGGFKISRECRDTGGVVYSSASTPVTFSDTISGSGYDATVGVASTSASVPVTFSDTVSGTGATAGVASALAMASVSGTGATAGVASALAMATVSGTGATAGVASVPVCADDAMVSTTDAFASTPDMAVCGGVVSDAVGSCLEGGRAAGMDFRRVFADTTGVWLCTAACVAVDMHAQRGVADDPRVFFLEHTSTDPPAVVGNMRVCFCVRGCFFDFCCIPADLGVGETHTVDAGVSVLGSTCGSDDDGLKETTAGRTAAGLCGAIIQALPPPVVPGADAM